MQQPALRLALAQVRVLDLPQASAQADRLTEAGMGEPRDLLQARCIPIGLAGFRGQRPSRLQRRVLAGIGRRDQHSPKPVKGIHFK